jgi:hypothetical protein
MEIKLTDEQLHGLVSEAILRALDENQRNILIQNAIAVLLAPKKDSYGYKITTPLQDAFNNAIAVVSQRIASETMLNDENVKAKMRGLLDEAMDRVFDKDREKHVQRVADSISSAMYCHGSRD